MKRVIVTRAAREAQAWVRDLTAAGLDAQALPLLEIRPVSDTSALQQAWQEMTHYAAVMFVSANAVDGFFAVGAHTDFKSRAWATGPGTVAALKRAGVDSACIDAPATDAAQFDSEALWLKVGSQVKAGQRVLIVRGAAGPEASAVGRDWLAQRLSEAGATVDFVASYRRVSPALDAAQMTLAKQAALDGAVWLFSSSEAVSNLRETLPAQDWKSARAVATHARIAAATRRAGFGLVLETRPSLADIVASIESMA